MFRTPPAAKNLPHRHSAASRTHLTKASNSLHIHPFHHPPKTTMNRILTILLTSALALSTLNALSQPIRYPHPPKPSLPGYCLFPNDGWGLCDTTDSSIEEIHPSTLEGFELQSADPTGPAITSPSPYRQPIPPILKSHSNQTPDLTAFQLCILQGNSASNCTHVHIQPSQQGLEQYLQSLESAKSHPYDVLVIPAPLDPLNQLMSTDTKQHLILGRLRPLPPPVPYRNY